MNLAYLGFDARLDAPTGDFVLPPSGDIYPVDGEKLVLQDVWMRLVTPRGSLWCHPTYGVDLYDYLHAEDSHLNRMGIRAAVREELLKEPRVVPESIEVKTPTMRDRDHIEVEVSFIIEGLSNRQNFVLGYDLTHISQSVVKGVLL